MAWEITRSILLAAALGGGITFGTIGSATAAYCKPYPPSPHSPTQEQATQIQNAKQTATWQQRSNSAVAVHVHYHDDGDDHEHSVPMSAVMSPPRAGAPVEASIATGAAMLLAGTASTAIVMRRRETSGVRKESIN
ncbi:hypothetical protein ACTWPT_51825 [Nonomuraea sp. 3N208]|uniref:hypothetical protein n=1 Tax=Nonomuraea sp. 3N208 TaxID=3457421 RepID=UPI003FD2DA79